MRDRFGPLPPAAENLMFQIDVKLLAQAAGATAVIAPDNKVLVRLPYLPDINRERLQHDLTGDIIVTRTALEIPLEQASWQLSLLDVLEQLAQARSAIADTAGL